LGFSHIDGSPGASGGNALTPHEAQIGDTSPSSVSSHRSLMTPVSPTFQCFVHHSNSRCLRGANPVPGQSVSNFGVVPMQVLSRIRWNFRPGS